MGEKVNKAMIEWRNELDHDLDLLKRQQQHLQDLIDIANAKLKTVEKVGNYHVNLSKFWDEYGKPLEEELEKLHAQQRENSEAEFVKESELTALIAQIDEDYKEEEIVF